MQYFDKDGREIKAGMKLLMEDGSITRWIVNMEQKRQKEGCMAVLQPA